MSPKRVTSGPTKNPNFVLLLLSVKESDLFAAFALAGLYLSEKTARANVHKEDSVWQGRMTAEEYAKAAYEQADALLAARKAEKDQP